MKPIIDISIVKDREEAIKVQLLAREIWMEHYKPIIGQDQVEYMLSKFQSADAICQDISEKGYEYFTLRVDGKLCGYSAISYEKSSESLFLSKLYISGALRGRGLGRQLLDYLANKYSPSEIWLTVNKHNHNSIKAYQRMGFHIIREQKTDIGSGFYMDDHVMKLKCEKPAQT